MSKMNTLMSQLSAKGYDGKAAPVGATLADEMLDHVSGGLAATWYRLWLRWYRLIIVY